MQGVILAAGKSSRLFPFGGSTHKAALSLMGKSLISRTIENLRACSVEEIIVVVSPDNGIEKTLRDEGVRLTGITFVHHVGAQGMGEALLDCAEMITGDFFLVHAHHFEVDQFLPQLLRRKQETTSDGAILIRREANSVGFGVVTLDGEKITEVIEKPQNASGQYRIVGMYVLPHAFLRQLNDTKKDHYSFEAALHEFVKESAILGVKTDKETITLKYPWHILDVGEYLLRHLKEARSKDAKIAQSAVLEGDVVVSDGVTIESGAVVKGPCFLGENVYIGTNAIVRGGTILEKDVVIGANMEVKHSILLRGTTTHSGYVGDSVIGEECKVAAFFCTGNVRIDRADVAVVVKNEKVDSQKKSLGVFMGNRTKVGIRVSTMPGVLIGQDVTIGPSTTVFKNISSNVRYYTKVTEVIEEGDAEKGVKTRSDKSKVVLFDIDYTLFDTKVFKDSNLKTFSVYQEVVGILGEIGAYATLGIFSEGEEAFQKAKLLETSIESHFNGDNVHVVQKKRDAIPEILDLYKKNAVFLVDDRLEVLFLAKKHMKELFTIWMKRGPFALEQQLIERFSPDAVVDDLRMVLPIVAAIEE